MSLVICHSSFVLCHLSFVLSSVNLMSFLQRGSNPALTSIEKLPI
ncbi:hypothetical protein [Coleofasciculus sp. F4-SAH-05]